MRPEFWRDRRVLVTGHTGFKGGWLCVLLRQLGANVTGFALPPATEPNLFTLAGIEGIVHSVIGDVRRPEQVAAAVEQAKPEFVFHLAAQALVLPSYERPVDTYATNVMGTVHVLEAARHSPSVRSVVVVTSDKCYENQEWSWGYRETDRLGGRDPYSNSKACAELVTAAYRTSFFRGRAGLASVRAGNVIGGGDFAQHRIVPDFARSVLAGQPLTVRNPRSTRPWQHVLEPLEGYLLAAEKLTTSDHGPLPTWNFGPALDAIQTVATVADDLCAEWGPGARWAHQPSDQPHEAGILALDASHARQTLGWRPRLGYRQGLRWTVQWYKALANGGDLAAQTAEQVTQYLELAS